VFDLEEITKKKNGGKLGEKIDRNK